MHEYSLAKALLTQVDRVRREHGDDRVLSVCVSLGEFAGVEADLFIGAFEMLVGETAMSGAELELNRIPLTCRCDECGLEFPVQRFRFECPECRCVRVTIIKGQDVFLESVTLEQAEPALPSGDN